MFLKNLILTSFTIYIFSVSYLFSQQQTFLPKNHTVNYILGDESFSKTYGMLTGSNTNEKQRIKTHLEYVENLLKNKKQEGLSAALFSQRNSVIGHLRGYIEKEQFPSNYDYRNERKPCFIDKNGNICAVGYLIEQTAGRQMAEEINSKYKYSYIHEMKDEKLSCWIENSGLTVNECAMIQPQYGEPDYGNDGLRLTTEYALSSSMMSGINLTMAALNTIDIANKKRSFSRSIIGVISGMTQLILGVINIKGIQSDYYNYNYSSEPRRMVSMLNVGLGSATTILSLINLFSDDAPASIKK